MSVCGLLSCNLAFVCRQIIDCNDDCLWRESEANGFRRQNFVFRVELVIVDGLLFVGSQLSKSYDGDDKYVQQKRMEWISNIASSSSW